MTAVDLVESFLGKHLTAGHGDRVAYIDPEIGEVSYRQLYYAAGLFAARLTAQGIRPASRCLVVADDSVAACAVIIGLWWHGCIPVPVSPYLTEKEIGFIAEDSGAPCTYLDVPQGKRAGLAALLSGLEQFDRALVVADLAEAGAGVRTDLPHAPAQLPPRREALVQYTSGSTGVPKGVLHSAAALLAVPSGYGRILALGPADIVVSTAKLSFGYGFGNSVLLPLHAGACTILLRGGVDAYTVARALRTHRPTVLCSVPRIYASLPRVLGADEIRDHALRLAVTAGERCPAELMAATERLLGVTVLNGLGATEALHIVVATDDRSAPGATGSAVPGAVATVRDDDGQVLADGVDGRLHIAGPTVALGYLNRPDAQQRTFADGGVYTGDTAQISDGSVRYLARTDDMLNLGGHKVAPGEIEAVIQSVPGVAECAVVSGPNADGLDDAIAYLVSAGPQPAELRGAVLAALRANLAPFKRPSRIEVVDALPTTSTGKLARFQLRTIGAH
ncbi:AMP-binding protein [Nocardia brasiliensis]|uniref:AMP-binding protein n=1 Tax=Nocardia brasiliensis TaxID=37326 RepID=UPI00055A0B91|nr:AMP-binding protein [Nocardia brasiliensis]